MQEAEFIQFHSEESPELRELLIDGFNDAILEFAFSNDEMALISPRQFLSNLIKNEIAKGIFFYFLRKRNPTFETADSEYKTGSKIDFYFQKCAWTLIHNFIRKNRGGGDLKFHQLPALIPNASDNDLWTGRGLVAGSMNRKFVFTFMDESDLNGILSIVENKISQKAIDLLTGLNRNFNSGNGDLFGFSKPDILTRFRNKTSLPNFQFRQVPILYIGGVAGLKEFDFFADSDDDRAHGYAMYTGRYYDHHAGGGLNFLNGTLITKIRNATCPMEALPAFKNFVG